MVKKLVDNLYQDYGFNYYANKQKAIKEAKANLARFKQEANASFAKEQELTQVKERLQQVTTTLLEQGKGIKDIQAIKEHNDDEDISLSLRKRRRALKAAYAKTRPLRHSAYLQNIADEFTKYFKNGPNIIVLTDYNDPKAHAAITSYVKNKETRGKKSIAFGAYHGKTSNIYLFANRIKNEKRLITTLAHELLEHHGLRGNFGKDLDNILNQIATMRKTEVLTKLKAYKFKDTKQNRRRAFCREY